MGKIKKYIFKRKEAVSWAVKNITFFQKKDYGYGTDYFHGMYFSSDGLNLFLCAGVSYKKIVKFTGTVAWDISTFVYSQEVATPQGGECLWVSPDGLTIYNFGGQYTSTWGMYLLKLSVPYDLSTLLTTTFYIDEVRPTGLFFAPDGLSYYTVNYYIGSVNKYTLSTAWDYTTRSGIIQTFNSGLTTATGITFREDGLKMYISSRSEGDILEYNLNTPYDLTTCSYVDVKSLDLTPSWQFDIYIRQDGLKFYNIQQGNSLLGEYNWK